MLHNFTVILNTREILKPKGLYYQGKYVVLVGDVASQHTIRNKIHLNEIKDIKITKKRTNVKNN